MKPDLMRKRSSSWGKSSKWYTKLVGTEGHYYHQHLVLPETVKLLSLKQGDRLADIACGQGILGRAIRQDVEYAGTDISQALVTEARKLDHNPLHRYEVFDATKGLSLPKNHYTSAAIVLALQNIREADKTIEYCAGLLTNYGRLVIILNHPSFRIPRQSGWDNDVTNKQQRRWVLRYMTPMEIPITMHPGKKTSDMTWSFHRPLSYYVDALRKSGFVIDTIDELVSDKESTGKSAKMENRSRSDIPLFMAIRAIKIVR